MFTCCDECVIAYAQSLSVCRKHSFTHLLTSLFFAVIAILTKASDNPHSISGELFLQDQTIKMLPDYITHQRTTIVARSLVELSFDSLRPSCQYSSFVVVDRNTIMQGDKASSTPDLDAGFSIARPTHINITTATEVLIIEWERLELDMKIVELRAAIRSEFVQDRAYQQQVPAIELPSDAELLSADFSALLTAREHARTSSAGRDTVSPPKSAAAPPSQSTSVKLKGSAKRASSGKKKSRVEVFLDWWIGSDQYRSRVRADYQLLECLYALLEGSSFGKTFLEEGFVNVEEMIVLNEFATLCSDCEDADERDKLLHPSTTPDPQGLTLLQRFRSWYKGGQVIADHEEADRQRYIHKSLALMITN